MVKSVTKDFVIQYLQDEEIADDFAKEEFHKFRVIQDKNYKSDFDKAILKALKDNNAKYN